jgi:hypothetical protein
MVDINITTNSMLPVIPQEIGKTSDGRIIYETKYQQTGKVTKFTVPEENQDKFEKTVQEIHRKYGKYNIDTEKKLAKAAHLTTLGGALLGGALTASLIKTKSKMGKFAKVLTGALGGVIIASMALAGAIFYPITKYIKELKNLGYKQLDEPSLTIKEEKNTHKTEETQLLKTEKE